MANRYRTGLIAACLAACSVLACGSVNDAPNDGGSDDDAGVSSDGGPVVAVDAGDLDAAPTAAPPPSKGLGPGSTRVTGGGYTVDVQLGHSIEQQPASGGGTEIEGAAPVKK